MAPRTTFANLAQGYSPFTLFDQSFSDVGLLGNIPCTCVTTANVIALTPVIATNPATPAASAYPPSIVGYQNYLKFAFVADATSSGAVTAVIAGPAGTTNSTLPVYKNGGVQVTTGDIILGTYYELAFAAALNGGNGGFYLLDPLFAASVFPAIANNTVLGNNTGGSASPAAISASAVLDMVGNTSGSLVIRGASTWATAVPGGDVTIGTTGVTAIGANKVANTMIRQGVARSVIGVTGNATANVADIQGTTNQVLVVNSAGTALAFGQVNLAASAAVTGLLAGTNGGTGVNNGAFTFTLGGSLTVPAILQGDLMYGSSTAGMSALNKSATATRYLANTGASNNPAWDQVNLTNGVTGTLASTLGGTDNAVYAIGDLLQASATTALARLAAVSASSVLLSGGVSTVSAWSAIKYPTSATSGGVLYLSSTTAIASSALLAANQIVLGGGAGTAPATLGSLGTTTTVLHGNAGGAPTFGAIVAADVTTNTLTNATLAQAAANTFKGNPTVSTANVTDFTIGSLTSKATPVAADTLIIADSAASGALKVATVGSVGSVGTVTSIATNTGAFTLTQPITNSTNAILLNATITPQGRLTLATATPVMTASQAAKTTVFYTPYAGNLVPIYDGTNFIPMAFAELSQLTTDATKSPAAVAGSSVYDLFVWNDTGTLRCTRGPVWTNDTTRSAGTALVVINGVYLNNASITNGPAASRGTYVGTIRSNAASQIDYIFGAAASGGTAAVLYVWNAYNRVSTGTVVSDSGAQYTYAVATIRQARASTGNQINFVLGLSEDAVWAAYSAKSAPAISTSGRSEWGIGFDSTTSYGRQPSFGRNNSATNGIQFAAPATGQNLFAIGVHYVAALQNSPDTSATTYDQDSTDTLEAIIRN